MLTTQKIADTLQISESSIENYLYQLVCTHLFDVWISHKLSNKSLPDHISHAILYWKVRITFHFKNKVWWKMKSGTEEIMGKVKWTTTNCTKGWSPSKEGDVEYTMVLEGSPLLWASSEKPNN